VSALGAMLRAGGRALIRHPWLVIALYAAQLVTSLVAGGIVATALANAFAGRAVLEHVAAGDLGALAHAIRSHGTLLFTLALVCVAAALLWGVVSWFATGGLIAVVDRDQRDQRDQGDQGDQAGERGDIAARFGAGGARAALPFARLFLWCLVPYTVIVVLAGVAVGPVLDRMTTALTVGELVRSAALRLAPCALVWVLLRTAIDYARIEIVTSPRTPAWRALLRGFALLVRRPMSLAHVAIYCAASAGIVAAYLALTWNSEMAGVGGALGLFALRQAMHASRFALGVALISGQIRLFRQ